MTIGRKSGASYSGDGITIEFDRPSVKQALGNFSNYDSRTRKRIADAIKKSMKNVERGAKKRVSVRTGDLRDSIKTSFDSSTMKGSVTANEFYAHFSEFGTREEMSRPYMRPAYEAERPNLIRGISDAVKL